MRNRESSFKGWAWKFHNGSMCVPTVRHTRAEVCRWMQENCGGTLPNNGNPVRVLVQELPPARAGKGGRKQ